MLEAAIVCLAHNVFFEARGETVLGQYAVAQVTLRRAGGDPRRVCREVYRSHQFSWTLEPRRNPRKVDQIAYENARRIARVVLTGRMPMDFSRGATHYHAVTVRPYWSTVMIRTTRVGRHLFYA
jgi:spore germination cell wall hydrolase CwlJ-like protein